MAIRAADLNWPAAWNSTGSDQLADRFQPAVIEVSTALVHLSLMSHKMSPVNDRLQTDRRI
jgi:hypothetical protein